MASGSVDRPGWKRNGQWHEDERVLLRRSWRRGDSINEIAATLERDVDAVLLELRASGELDRQSGAPAASRLPALLRGWSARPAQAA